MSAYSLGPLLHEGKAKRVYSTDQADLLAVEFKDDATAFNAQKKAQLSGKGALNCQISALLFEHLELQGIPTHFLGLPPATEPPRPEPSFSQRNSSRRREHGPRPPSRGHETTTPPLGRSRNRAPRPVRGRRRSHIAALSFSAFCSSLSLFHAGRQPLQHMPTRWPLKSTTTFVPAACDSIIGHFVLTIPMLAFAPEASAARDFLSAPLQPTKAAAASARTVIVMVCFMVVAPDINTPPDS